MAKYLPKVENQHEKTINLSSQRGTVPETNLQTLLSDNSGISINIKGTSLNLENQYGKNSFLEIEPPEESQLLDYSEKKEKSHSSKGTEKQ